MKYSFSTIISYLNVPEYKSWGWQGRFRVTSANESTGSISVVVDVELIDVNYDVERLKPLCEDIVQRRLKELDAKYPGIIKQFNPKINVTVYWI